MKWVRNYAWLVAPVFLVVYFVWLRPIGGPNPKQVMADLEAERAVIEKGRADREARRAELDRKVGKLWTDSTLFRLRILGEAYRVHLTHDKKPPRAADLADVLGDVTSARDKEPFEVVWGVDPAKLPNGGTGHRLAWEATAAADGSRCLLLADAKTAKVVTATEFEALPKAVANK